MDLVTNGSTIGTLICVYDLGEREKTVEWVKQVKPTMRLVFELPEFKKETKDGMKSVTAKLGTVTKFSNDKSTAYKIANAFWVDISWQTTQEVLKTFIGLIWKSCLVDVENADYNNNPYVRINNAWFAKIPWVMQSSIVPPTIETASFSFDDADWKDNFDKLPERLQSQIKPSQSYSKLLEAAMVKQNGSVDDDLMF